MDIASKTFTSRSRLTGSDLPIQLLDSSQVRASVTFLTGSDVPEKNEVK